jgi:hypothetical protein
MIARGFVPYGGVALVLSSVCMGELAWADSWGSPSREFARYGVRTIVATLLVTPECASASRVGTGH